MITIQRKVRFGQKGRKQKATGKPAVGCVPRVARLMALAIRFDQLIRDGVVADQAELARLGRVTRARLTQIMNLLQLAPDIQEELLFLLSINCGESPIHERELRTIVAVPDWRQQRRMWREMRSSWPLLWVSVVNEALVGNFRTVNERLPSITNPSEPENR